jgi:hypothetical protein
VRHQRDALFLTSHLPVQLCYLSLRLNRGTRQGRDFLGKTERFYVTRYHFQFYKASKWEFPCVWLTRGTCLCSLSTLGSYYHPPIRTPFLRVTLLFFAGISTAGTLYGTAEPNSNAQIFEAYADEFGLCILRPLQPTHLATTGTVDVLDIAILKDIRFTTAIEAPHDSLGDEKDTPGYHPIFFFYQLVHICWVFRNHFSAVSVTTVHTRPSG